MVWEEARFRQEFGAQLTCTRKDWSRCRSTHTLAAGWPSAQNSSCAAISRSARRYRGTCASFGRAEPEDLQGGLVRALTHSGSGNRCC